MKPRDPSLELSKSVLRLDTEEGKLRWTKDIVLSNGRLSCFRAGKIAAAKGDATIGGIVYPALRVAWLLHYGTPAIGSVVPLDGDHSNVRPENMLDCGARPARSAPIWPASGDGAPQRKLSRIERELNADMAKAVFAYDEGTGALSWKVDRWTNRGRPTARAGEPVGSSDQKGYLVVLFQPAYSDKANYYFVHRIIWLMKTGQWPVAEVDHRDGIKSNNQWLNLRHADDEFNSQNRRRANKNNGTGMLGVTFDKASGKYDSRIGHRRKLHQLGSFDTPEEAHQAYVDAKRLLHAGGTL